MHKTWAWIAGVSVGLCIVGLIGDVRSDERAYSYARGALIRQVQNHFASEGSADVQVAGSGQVSCNADVGA
jgi:hypothetical protein